MSAKFTSMGFALLLILTDTSRAADIATGKKIHEERCADCHETSEFAGEDVKALDAKLKDVATGKVKHKIKIKLTDEEIANVAAFWSAASSK